MSNNRCPTYATIAIIAVVIIATAAVILWFKPDSNDIIPRALHRELSSVQCESLAR